MPTCSVFGCFSGDGSKETNIQQFTFPTAKNLHQKWLEQLNRKDYVPTSNSRICIKHFTDDDFLTETENLTKRGKKRKSKTLKPLAVPTVHLNPSKVPKLDKVTDHKYSATKGSTSLVDHSYLPKKKDVERTENVLQPQNESTAKHFLDLGAESEVDSDKNATIENLLDEVKRLKKENLKLQIMSEKIREIFHDDQISKLLMPPSSLVHWSDEMLSIAIKAYYTCGSTGYNYLRKTMKIPLPAISTLQSHLSKISCEPGTLNDFFKMMKIKVDSMEERDKLCSVSLDEMSIMPKREFDMTTQSYYGFVTLPLSKAMQKKKEKAGITTAELAHHAFSGKFYQFTKLTRVKTI